MLAGCGDDGTAVPDVVGESTEFAEGAMAAAGLREGARVGGLASRPWAGTCVWHLGEGEQLQVELDTPAALPPVWPLLGEPRRRPLAAGGRRQVGVSHPRTQCNSGVLRAKRRAKTRGSRGRDGGGAARANLQSNFGRILGTLRGVLYFVCNFYHTNTFCALTLRRGSG